MVRPKHLTTAIAVACALPIAGPATADMMYKYSDRDAHRVTMESSWQASQAQLQESLRPGQPRDWYKKQLESMGFTVTSVNYNDDDYLEYEVVRGRNSFEVQIDIDDDTKKGTEIEIDPNIIQADATEKALGQARMRMKNRKPVAHSDRYNREVLAVTWHDGRDELERTLVIGNDKAWYPERIEGLGYKITSVNYNNPDYVEYEIVKGEQTYELQIDIDDDTGKVEEIEIEPNLIQAEATEKALRG